jgi:hypothetical protein
MAADADGRFAGGQGFQGSIYTQMHLQTPGLGMDGGHYNQDRSEFIPANYGSRHTDRRSYGVAVEENTLELRKAVLHTRYAAHILSAFSVGNVEMNLLPSTQVLPLLK